MAKPTRQECLDGARDVLSDTEYMGGDYFTNAVLEKSYDSAFRDMVRGMEYYLIPELERVTYFHVPALVGEVDFSAYGISLLSDPWRVREGVVSAVYAVDGVTNTAPLTITTATTPLTVSAQDRIYVVDVGGQVTANGTWIVSGVVGDDITVVGGRFSDPYTSGGKVLQAAALTEMYPVNVLNQETVAVSNREFVWRDSIAYMNPIPAPLGRVIEVSYFERVAPPQSGELPFDDSLDFMKFQTASYAAGSSGAFEHSAKWAEVAKEKLAIWLRNYRIRKKRG